MNHFPLYLSSSLKGGHGYFQERHGLCLTIVFACMHGDAGTGPQVLHMLDIH